MALLLEMLQMHLKGSSSRVFPKKGIFKHGSDDLGLLILSSLDRMPHDPNTSDGARKGAQSLWTFSQVSLRPSSLNPATST